MENEVPEGLKKFLGSMKRQQAEELFLWLDGNPTAVLDIMDALPKKWKKKTPLIWRDIEPIEGGPMEDNKVVSVAFDGIIPYGMILVFYGNGPEDLQYFTCPNCDDDRYACQEPLATLEEAKKTMQYIFDHDGETPEGFYAGA